MLSDKTKVISGRMEPPKGACGGTGIYFLSPRRHWCKMSESDIALHILAGGEIYDSWDVAGKAIALDQRNQLAWHEGSIAVRIKGHASWVRLNSQCPAVHTRKRKGVNARKASDKAKERVAGNAKTRKGKVADLGVVEGRIGGAECYQFWGKDSISFDFREAENACVALFSNSDGSLLKTAFKDEFSGGRISIKQPKAVDSAGNV